MLGGAAMVGPVGARWASTALYLAVVAAVAGLSALADVMLRSEAVLFRAEPVVVGCLAALATAAALELMLRLRGREEAPVAAVGAHRILPICSGCKRIRRAGHDEALRESWEPVETYFARHTDVELSHGLCPDCAQQLYPRHTTAGNEV